ncbi:cytochrome c biogenesis protein ResB [Candidatus Omnitrophota bacterium]
MKKTTTKNDGGLLSTLSSIQFGIVILIAIAIVSIVGTLLPQGNPLQFYQEHYSSVTYNIIKIFRFDISYHSPLFIGLMLLFGLNLILCSVRRFPALLKRTMWPDTAIDPSKISSLPVHFSLQHKTLDDISQAFSDSGFRLRIIDDKRLYGEKWRAGYLGSSIVHISLLIFLAGGMISLVTGKKGALILETGQTKSEITLADDSTIPLGVDVTLNHFHVEFYENFPGRPKEYTSSVTVKEPDAEPYQYEIQVNHPLLVNGFTIYQSSYGESAQPHQVSAENDTVTVSIRLKTAPAEVPPVDVIDMVMGTIYPVPGFDDSLKISIAELHRDFRRAQTVSGEANPAVKLNVYVRDEIRWSVYAFQNFRGMNMPMADNLDILFGMDALKMGESEAHTDHSHEEYYTVLGATIDKGANVMWFGSAAMIVGMFFSFYVRPKRIWVYDDNGNVLIGAVTKGDSAPFRTFIKDTIAEIKG